MSLKPNGHNGTLVGHRFDHRQPDSMPGALYHRDGNARFSSEVMATKAAELTEHYAIVETCSQCSPSRPLIASEVLAHRLKHAPNSTVRSMVATVLQQSPENQKLVLEMLKELVK